MTTADDVLRVLGQASTTDLARALDDTQRAVRYFDQLFGALHNLTTQHSASNHETAVALLRKIRTEIHGE